MSSMESRHASASATRAMLVSGNGGWPRFFFPHAFFRLLCPFLGGGALGTRAAQAVFSEASTLTCKALPGRQAGHTGARQQVTDVGAGPVKVAKARRRQASQALSKS